MSTKSEKQNKENLTPRPPIVVVMGHIDHGKTTLLDYIRKTKVTESETGGITQHVGAYEIEVPASPANRGEKNTKITFLDTPGHEAFSQIRKHGAKIADIAVLVVAADDGVKTQTEESIQAIQKTGIPYIIAINKIDKENAAPDKIKKELSEKGIQIEEWGGKIPCVNISAKTGNGVNELLEMVNLIAELEDLKTDPNANASGYVLESYLDKKRGIAATLIIQNGKLKKGMRIVAKNATAPVRILENFLGEPLKEAGASSPVKITGFNETPESGFKFESFSSKKDAETTKTQIQRHRVLVDKDENDKNKVIIPLLIKADAKGSVDALVQQLKKAETKKVCLKIVRAKAGDITEDDAKLASGSENSIIIGFNVNASSNAKMLAERFEIQIKIFNIIYKAEDWIKEEIEKRTPKEEKEEIIGKAGIIKIFRDEKNKKIIGGEVKIGKITAGKKVKIYRREFLLGGGEILEVRHNKSKTEEVPEGQQFGALLQTKVNLAPKDTLEIYS
ncbi:MAG: translation initiation factor IF-2 [Candidatus Tagabacteria bacterium CG09_land_8_20_14_0_10_41_14]|uniref:Translation initiation factor IF-2 n=2 Tax=Candidatus Tagaibacteriota TaxID=1817918 RepID=A0A2H0WNU1_9BACT|nr:MAG: translation initiation factor IF-2 [Candidatus Tagabacteria bacterium CG09_land_8_20_14_0_10_41_14]PJE73158.1 MAG: translation initiation factor IF-2 [Candidatus Tagabacteria bacterium CG10_big_fil_rev_8_21_14_0_10_40_13]